MNDVIWKRAVDIGEYIRDTQSTVRELPGSLAFRRARFTRMLQKGCPKSALQLAKLVRENAGRE